MALTARRTLSSLALAAALVVTLVGCGSGVADVVARSDRLPENPRERAIVQAGILRRADFPPGWTSKARRADSTDADLDRALRSDADCRRVARLSDNVSDGKAKSPNFMQGEQEMSNEAEIYRTVAKVDQLQLLLVEPSTIECFRTAFVTGLNVTLAKKVPAGAAQPTVAVTARPLAIGSFGEGANGIGLQSVISLGDRAVVAYVDLVAVKVGRTQLTYTFLGTTPDPVGAFGAQLITTTVRRVQAASA